MTTKTIIRIIALSLALLFFYAAVSKLDQYSIFRLQLQKFPLALPLVKQMAWLVPVTELVIAGLLLFPALQVKGLFSALFFLSLYTIYLTCMPDSRFTLPCRCGEPWPSFSVRSNMIFNLLCVLVASVGVVLCGKVVQPLPYSNDNYSSASSCYEETIVRHEVGSKM
jgi:hypothetical protein